jgi:hypothetical protein
MHRIKVVINTHPTYRHILEIVLGSLDYRSHREDIILCISDVEADRDQDIRSSYVEAYGLDPSHVLTTHVNIDEYSAFVALSTALRNGTTVFPEETMFLMLHDTCEAGRLFWGLLVNRAMDIVDRCNDRDNLPRFDEDQPSNEIYKIPIDCQPIKHMIRMEKSGINTMIMFRQFMWDRADGKMKTSCIYEDGGVPTQFNGVLTTDCTVTVDDHLALVLDSTESPMNSALRPHEFISESIRNKCMKYMWWPVSENFNLGIATTEFIMRAGSAFEGISSLSKNESISVEIDADNPLYLKNIATVDGIPRWRYVFDKEWNTRECRFPTMSLWLNDTDVYGNGKMRNISYLHTLDLKKYSCLVGKNWDAQHESGR